MKKTRNADLQTLVGQLNWRSSQILTLVTKLVKLIHHLDMQKLLDKEKLVI